MNELDKQILNQIQKSFPLQERPFKTLADQFNCSEVELINSIKRLKNEEKIIRNISGIFNIEKLGYHSTLVAFNVQPYKLNKIAEIINNITTVSHNYQRDDFYNLWFTLSLPINENVMDYVKKLTQEINIEKYFVLPAKQIIKAEVIFDLINDNNIKNINIVEKTKDKTVTELSSDEKKVINELQDDIPLIENPFKVISEYIEMDQSKFLEISNQLLKKQIMKRFSATIRHRKAGFYHNAMVIWEISEDNINNIASQIFQLPFVSHCYERVVYPEWTFNFYTMMHARSKEEFENQLARLKIIMNNSPCMVLKTIKEFKKERVKYYLTP